MAAQFDILLRTKGIMGVADLHEAFVKELKQVGMEVRGATAEEEPGSATGGIVLSMAVVCGAPADSIPPRERIEAALDRLRRISGKPFSAEVVQATIT